MMTCVLLFIYMPLFIIIIVKVFCFYNIHYLYLICGGWTVWVILVQSSYCCAVDVRGYGDCDTWSHLFGFQKIESRIDGATSRNYCFICLLELIIWYVVYKFLLYSLFKVNIQPIFICGGNWILSDGLLCLSKERYKTDIKFHTDMNLNMIRCWGGGLAERPKFYHCCDIYGLLVISLSLPPTLCVCVMWTSNSTGNIETLHSSALDICPWVALRRKFH